MDLYIPDMSEVAALAESCESLWLEAEKEGRDGIICWIGREPQAYGGLRAG